MQTKNRSCSFAVSSSSWIREVFRCTQLASSTVVGSILSYFASQLRQNALEVPWTFILLLTVSCLTVVIVTITIVAHRFTAPRHRLRFICNAFLTVIWAVGFALFTWWTSGTLLHACRRDIWKSDAGISICQTYKALFTFALLGLLSIVPMAYLDFVAWREHWGNIQYDPMKAPNNVRLQAR